MERDYIYVISVEGIKPTNLFPDGKVFYSRINGCKSKLSDADTFTSFEQAQPTVKKLRSFHTYVYAIKVHNAITQD